MKETHLLWMYVHKRKFYVCKLSPFVPSLKFSLLLFFTFNVLLSSYAQQWKYLSNEDDIASGASAYTSIALLTDGAAVIPHLAFTENNMVKVKKYDGDQWLQVGNAVSSSSASYTRLYIDGAGNLYICYINNADGRLALKKYDVDTEMWQPLANDNANLFVSDFSVNNTVSQFSSTPRYALAFDAANMPYIIYGEGSGLHPYVKRFNGSSWQVVGAGSVNSSHRAIGVSIAMDANGTPFIAYVNSPGTTGAVTVHKLVGNIWEPIAIPEKVNGSSSGQVTATRHTAIAFNSNGYPVITYFNASNSNKATAIVYNTATQTWSLSAVLSSRDITNNSLMSDSQSNIYASFTDAVSNGSGRSLARVFKQNAGSTQWMELKDANLNLGIDEPVYNVTMAVDETGRPYMAYTKNNASGVSKPVVRYFTNEAPPPPPPPPPPPADPVVTTPKIVEKLDRGVVAVRKSANEVFISWRLFGTEPQQTAFNVYRDGVRINAAPVTASTNFIDVTTENGMYTVKAIVGNVEGEASVPVTVWLQNYLNIPLQKPEGGITPDGVAYTYTANDCSVGDLDGDGKYEIILKWDPTNAKDNSQSGYTGNVYLDAYKMDGTRMWRIDLGRNIRAGAHYTQFMVYDLDGDGKAEVACKTADGTTDGKGVVIGNALADYRTQNGYVLSGPEFLTVFNGETGAAMATADYLPARGSVSSWGDNYGNRVDRFIAAVAYLDGAHPSLVMGRGYYTRLVRAAWDFRGGKLTSRWVFDSNNAGSGNHAGQGNHQMTIGDADGDGKDEVFSGASAVNDNGGNFWSNGLGHGDALHMSDMDPDRPGLEIWQPFESPGYNGNIGAALIDAKTGEKIFTVAEATADVGRGLAADIDPRHKGYEMWASRGALYNAKGVQIGTAKPSMNFAIWWDGDLQRELLDGNTISKWDYGISKTTPLLIAEGCSSNNSTKATPALSADLLGDWREEVIFRTTDNLNLRIYTTTIPTEHKIYTLMHDPQYRTAIAWQNSGYNQPPHPGFYLGGDMGALPVPNIAYAPDVIQPVAMAKNIEVELVNGVVTIKPEDINNNSYDAYGIKSLEINQSTFSCADLGKNEVVLTVTDNSGLTSTAKATVTVKGSLPDEPMVKVTRADATFTGVDANTVLLGYGAQQLTLSAYNHATETITYTWEAAPSLSSNNGTATFTPDAAGTYTLQVEATNGWGCKNASTVTLSVIDVRCGNNNDKVVVCHADKSLCVDAHAVKAHLQHGCTVGHCKRANGRDSIVDESIYFGNDNPNETALAVHPNPVHANGVIYLRLAASGSYDVSLFNTNGLLVSKLQSGNALKGSVVSFQIEKGKLRPGLYFIKLHAATGSITRRLMIQ